MKTFSYKIAVRYPRKIDQTIYCGSVQSDSPGNALKLALDDTFGDPDLSDPIFSLADWYGDSDELEEKFGEIEDDDDSFQLVNMSDDRTFVVEVEESNWTKTENGFCTEASSIGLRLGDPIIAKLPNGIQPAMFDWKTHSKENEVTHWSYEHNLIVYEIFND